MSGKSDENTLQLVNQISEGAFQAASKRLMAAEDLEAIPPLGPPPLLSAEQLHHLAQQGWLCLTPPESLSQSITQLIRNSSSFFNMPRMYKIGFYPAKLGTEFGYYHVADEKEYVTFRCHVHTDLSSTLDPTRVSPLVPKLENSADKAWREAGKFLYRILCDIARISELDLSIWSDILDGTLTMPETEDQMTYTFMRLFRYFPTTGEAAEHSDLGLLTLCVGDGDGLQVLDRASSSNTNRVWMDATAKNKNVTVLVGQTLRAISNGSLNPGMHRVVGNPNGRHSVIFALRHSPMHDVDFGLYGGEGRVDPKKLWKTIQGNRVNINAVKETRDMQRAKLNAVKLDAEGGGQETVVVIPTASVISSAAGRNLTDR